ncbi:MAG: hypothetical protein PHU04_03890 [Candidatus Peribacteraceae bacterium]|nr:hypothetical protein [Candidatus Peribacteraceae bacterium]
MPSNRKLLFGALCGFFLLWYILGDNSVMTEFAQAQGVTAGSGDLDLTQFLKKSAIFFDFAMFLIYATINVCSALLDPEFIFTVNGGTQGTGALLSIWQLSRNLTNVILAFMLVFVGLYAVIVPTQGGEFMKTHVAKFILAVILVNFSWFFPRVILDTAHVLAATIYSLPQAIGTQCRTEDANGNSTDCQYIAETWLFPTARRSDAEDNRLAAECVNIAEAGNNPNYVKISNLVCIRLAPYDEEFNTGLAMLHGLYVNHVRIVQAGKVLSAPGPADGTWASLEQLGTFIVQFMFILFYTVAALLPLVAMAVVFLIRIPIIWLTVAFMPFMFVGFVMGDKMGEADTMGIFKHFVKAAFLPAAIAIPLAVGFIMLNSVSGIACPQNGPYGTYLCNDQGMLISSIRNLWQLLWSFVAVIVMWVGVFAAISKMGSIYARAAGAIQSVGQNWGKFALKVPLALPFIPVETQGGTRQYESIMSASPLPEGFLRNPNIAIRNRKLSFQNMSENLRGGGSPEADAIATRQTRILEKIAEGMRGGRDVTSALRELSVEMRNSPERMRDVIHSQNSAVRAAMDQDGKVGNTHIDVILRKADEIDAERRNT